LNATNFSSTSDDSADAGGARTNSGNTSLNSDGSAGNPGKQTGAGGGDIIGGGADYQRQANAGDQTNVSGARSESQQANDASAQPEKPFDASTASYDGKDFHNVSSDAAYKLSDKALGQVNQNNYDNLQGRIADLGDKMPDVVMRGVNQNGVGDMEKLAGNSNDASSQYSQGGNWFAVATNQPTDSKNQLDQLGSNFARARSYAQNGQDGGVYAFAHSDGFTPNGNPVSEQSRHLKGSGMDAAAPFSKTLTAGESNMPFDSSKFTHLSTLSGNDAYNAPLPEGTAVPSFPRQAALGNNQSLKAIDKVVSAVEAQHGDHLQAVHAEREAQQKAQAQSDSSFFSRIPDALRSWF
jgi:hypothetical protein